MILPSIERLIIKSFLTHFSFCTGCATDRESAYAGTGVGEQVMTTSGGLRMKECYSWLHRKLRIHVTWTSIVIIRSSIARRSHSASPQNRFCLVDCISQVLATALFGSQAGVGLTATQRFACPACINMLLLSRRGCANKPRCLPDM